MESDEFRLSGTVKFGITAAVLLLVGAISFGVLTETNEAGWISVRQMPMSGTLAVYSEPGMYGQWGGSVEKYKQAATISFGSAGEEGAPDSQPIGVRFNDSGKALIRCNARFELPWQSAEKMLRIHTQYRSYDHLRDTLLEPFTAEIVLLTASMFSSEDTYAGGRAEVVRLAEDQLRNGKYQTDVREEEITDEFTQEKRRIRKVVIRKDANGVPLRLENPLEAFDIQATQFIVDADFEYETGILSQINAQREAFMQTVTARAEAQKATQDKLTAEAKGQAAVSTARYEEEVVKEKARVAAEREKEVAEINADKLKAVAEVEKEQAEIEAKKRLEVSKLERAAAEETKKKEILLGEGESTRKKLVMEADGALQAKLEAYVTVNRNYAQALSDYKGSWVPAVSMGSSGGTSNAGLDLIQLLAVKAAKDLHLDTMGLKYAPALQLRNEPVKGE